MSKRLTVALAIAALVLLTAYGAVLAQGGGPGIDLQSLPGVGWYVAWQVQNVGNAPASLVVEAIPAEGTNFSRATRTETVQPGAGITFIPGKLHPLNPPLDEGFIGSAVLTSDQPTVAIGFVTNQLYPGGGLGIDGGTASAAYQGISGDNAGPTVSFPLVKTNWFGQSTTFYVQAAGAPASVTMTYRMNDGTVVNDGPYNLDADEMKVFSPTDAGVIGTPTCGTDASTTPCLGGAVATSTTGDIVGIFTEHPHSADPAKFVNSTRGFGPDDAGTTLALPIVKNNFVGNSTGISVQNASSSNVTINATFTGALSIGGDKAACEGVTYSGTSVTLEPGKSYVYFPGLNNMGGFPTGCFGSGTITAQGGEIVATVTEADAAFQKQTIYAAFAVDQATRKVAVPLAKEDWIGATSGIAIQNVGDSSTQVTCTYNVVQSQGTNPGSVTLAPQTIGPGESTALYRVYRDPASYGPDAAKLEQSFSAVICESSSENIVAIVQEMDLNGVVDLNNYEGFNLPN